MCVYNTLFHHHPNCFSNYYYLSNKVENKVRITITVSQWQRFREYVYMREREKKEIN